MGTWDGILAPYFQVAKYKYEHGHKTSEQSLRDAASGILRTWKDLGTPVDNFKAVSKSQQRSKEHRVQSKWLIRYTISDNNSNNILVFHEVLGLIIPACRWF